MRLPRVRSYIRHEHIAAAIAPANRLKTSPRLQDRPMHGGRRRPGGPPDPRRLRLLPQRAQLPGGAGPRVTYAAAAPEREARDARPAGPARSERPRPASGREPFPLVSERERTSPPMTIDGSTDLEMLLRRVIREETGISPAAPAEKWRGGTFVLRPGTAGLQEKSWPIETFFHKVVMLRNRLRTLEQQVNGADIRTS